MNGPQVCGSIAERLEDEIFSIRGPVAAAFVGWGGPILKQGMKISAVRGSLPDGAIISLRIAQGETQSRAIGRPADVIRCSRSGQQPVRIAGVAVGQKYIVPLAVGDALTVGRPRSGMTLEVAQPTVCSTKNRHAPKRAVERCPKGGVHEEHRQVWRNIENVGKAGVFQCGGDGESLATGHRGLRKARLAFDEIETRAVGNDV